jgi:REP element-mobilizing transposase RayT
MGHPPSAGQRFCHTFVDILRQLREETGFLLVGWVLMPDHFHLLIRPEPAEATVRGSVNI